MRWLRHFVDGLLALVILFEEWGWEPLQALLARIARWPPWARLERRITALSPYAALTLTFAPVLLAVPVKLGALWLIARGQAVLGLVLIVAVKLIGTAIVARCFALTQPQLMRLAWFAALHARWVAWKAALLGRLRETPAWQRARAVVAAIRQRLTRPPR